MRRNPASAFAFVIAPGRSFTLVTYASTTPWHRIASGIGLALTFLTVLNSVMTPGERFLSAVQLSHELKEFELDMTIDMRRLVAQHPEGGNAVYNMLQKRNRQLSNIGEAMARGTLSTSTSRLKHQEGSGGESPAAP